MTEQLLTLNKHVRYRDVGGEGVLVHLAEGKVTVVNPVGLFIIQQLQQPKTRNQLLAAIIDEFEVSIGQAASDLDRFIAELDAEQLLSLEADAASHV